MIRACAVSDTGQVRKINEDTYVSDPEVRLFAVADGMGGHSAGEVASRLAIESLASFIHRSESETEFSWPFGVDRNLSFNGNRLRTAIHLANRRVFRAAGSSEAYVGMGTTIVGVLVNGNSVAVGHVGDSRLYVLSNGTLQQATHDDSWAATILAHDPGLGPDEIAHHPMRHVLTNVLGAREQVDVHLAERPLASGDVLLLCTDGLHGSLDPRSIAAILQAYPNVEAAATALVAAALESGSRDNVTALVVRYEAAE